MDLRSLKQRVEKMDHLHQVEVLRILHFSSDATSLSKETLQKLVDYAQYVEEQAATLDLLETEKKRLEDTFFQEKTSTLST
jgi:hypothetical protein